MKQKIKEEKDCPECGSQDIIHQYFESVLELKENRFICEECRFRWNED